MAFFRRDKIGITLAVGFVFCIFYYLRNPLSQSQHSSSTKFSDDLRGFSFASAGRPACYGLPGADDVLLVLKTGSTELKHKLPIHIKTTLRCPTDFLVFSDLAENIHGVEVFDALESVNPSIKTKNEDFALWRLMQERGRAALKNTELSGPVNPQRSEPSKSGNPGWLLDKWKFLPMLNRTLHEFPNKKWYVFVETDTFVWWHSLLEYFKHLDPTKPYYIGGLLGGDDAPFAHGGTGFIVSRPAMEKLVSMISRHQSEWEEFTDGHWAGDSVLGKAFKDSGTNLLGSYPLLQGSPVGNLDWPDYWCAPSISFHFISPPVVQDLFSFQEESISKAQKVCLFHVSTWHFTSDTASNLVHEIQGCLRAVCPSTHPCPSRELGQPQQRRPRACRLIRILPRYLFVPGQLRTIHARRHDAVLYWICTKPRRCLKRCRFRLDTRSNGPICFRERQMSKQARME
jgi:hypothetical protein